MQKLSGEGEGGGRNHLGVPAQPRGEVDGNFLKRGTLEVRKAFIIRASILGRVKMGCLHLIRVERASGPVDVCILEGRFRARDTM